MHGRRQKSSTSYNHAWEKRRPRSQAYRIYPSLAKSARACLRCSFRLSSIHRCTHTTENGNNSRASLLCAPTKRKNASYYRERMLTTVEPTCCRVLRRKGRTRLSLLRRCCTCTGVCRTELPDNATSQRGPACARARVRHGRENGFWKRFGSQLVKNQPRINRPFQLFGCWFLMTVCRTNSVLYLV